MRVKIYDVPVNGQPLKRMGLTRRATGEYELGLYEPGRFSITVHTGAPFAEEFRRGRLVEIDGVFWGVIKNRSVQRGSSNIITVSGTQLKGIMAGRVTTPLNMPPENVPVGYDSRAGTTEEVMKYFAENNTSGARRGFENLTVAPNTGGGNPDDKYYTRFENLSEVSSKLGNRAGLGWDIIGNEITGAFTFVTVQGTDRSAVQRNTKPIVFDIAIGTAGDFEYKEVYLSSEK